MDNNRTGELIRRLRMEKGMTQQQLARALCVSDRTVSKWERGAGCPDVSMLGPLSEFFGVNIGKILKGDLAPNRRDCGNVGKLKFYVCPDCGNLMTGTGSPEIYCCGRRLDPAKPQPADERHKLTILPFDGGVCASLAHPMEKQSYISFIARIEYDRVTLVKLYPEQDALANFAGAEPGRFYLFCTEHGLFFQ